MKKTATITFHASHNYGSMFQAYALQNILQSLNCENEIINFRTENQRETYSIINKRIGIKYFLKNCSHILFITKLKKKYNRFEQFIKNDLRITQKEYKTEEELINETFDYDYFICGSDQIWNPIPFDFNWAYYLNFVKNGKKISYATSFGQLNLQENIIFEKKIRDYLSDFSAISVRESDANNIIKKLINKESNVVLDPTLLLPKEEWDKLLSHEDDVSGDYILLYTLFSNKEINKIARKLSRDLNLKVVTTNFTNQYDVFNNYRKVYSCGPRQFLSLLKNAKLVLSSSYHGTLFSIIYHKPFFSFNISKDSRKKEILSSLGLLDREISLENYGKCFKNTYNIDFLSVDKILMKRKEESINFLKSSLDL